MPKNRKLIFLVSVLLLVTVGLVGFLFPRDEPKYHGRYLSEWMEVLIKPNPTEDEVEAVRDAVKKIGTNGLPMFVAWMSAETPVWKTSLRAKLPFWLCQKESIDNWLGKKDFVYAVLGMNGISILETNAASAVPALNSLMQTRTNTLVADMAITALTYIGGESIPVLKAAFADPKQPNRQRILWGIHRLSISGYTNECMPICIAALNDQDVNVRSKATNVLQATTFKDLIKLPRD